MESQSHEIKDIENIKKFIFAGDALITIKNVDTGNRFTFKIKKRGDKPRPTPIDLYWVSVLTMPNNNDDGAYKFIGSMSREEGFRSSPKSYIKDNSLSVKVANYYFNRLLGFSKFPLHSNVKTYHNGFCGRCGRILTVPESIETGFGADCAAIMDLPYEVKKGEHQTIVYDVADKGQTDYQIKQQSLTQGYADKKKQQFKALQQTLYFP